MSARRGAHAASAEFLAAGRQHAGDPLAARGRGPSIANALRYLRAFAQVLAANPEILLQKSGRTLIRGKIRRWAICLVPGLAAYLKRKHGITGGCISCGASCNLLFRCPQWNVETRLCTIYADRPLTCRQFPITPSDLADRSLAANGTPCGHSFGAGGAGRDESLQPDRG